MRHIFVNVIADGPINWKAPLTARGQPGIREAAIICTDSSDDFSIMWESVGELTSRALSAYSTALGAGGIVVGHSVEYHHGHLRAEMIARGADPCDGRVHTICTMLGLTGHVRKRNGKRGWPTFDEACDHFQITRAATETAEDNARCLLQVFRGMQRAEIEPEPKTWKERHGFGEPATGELLERLAADCGLRRQQSLNGVRDIRTGLLMETDAQFRKRLLEYLKAQYRGPGDFEGPK